MTGQKKNLEVIIHENGGDADKILDAFARSGFVVVPSNPTTQMLNDAWADIHDEDGLGVWKTMIVPMRVHWRMSALEIQKSVKLDCLSFCMPEIYS